MDTLINPDYTLPTCFAAVVFRIVFKNLDPHKYLFWIFLNIYIYIYACYIRTSTWTCIFTRKGFLDEKLPFTCARLEWCSNIGEKDCKNTPASLDLQYISLGGRAGFSIKWQDRRPFCDIWNSRFFTLIWGQRFFRYKWPMTHVPHNVVHMKV